MGDPLSVASGVIGIIAASAQLVSSLRRLGADMKDASSQTAAAAAELTNITIVVQGLQQYVLGQTLASPERLQLITIEHITTTLTGCIVTCSELDALLKSLHADTGLRTWDKAMYLLKKDAILKLTQRLQNHKVTFTMMLNILQCASLGEAERYMESLCDTVQEVLCTNQELASRLRNIEEYHYFQLRQVMADSVTQQAQESENRLPVAGTLVPNSKIATPGALTAVAAAETPRGEESLEESFSSFEDSLYRSRVYRNTFDDASLFSRDNDGQSTIARSLSSSVTLDEVSKISVFALPVYAAELSNSECYATAMDRHSVPLNARSTESELHSVTRPDSSLKSASSEDTTFRPSKFSSLYTKRLVADSDTPLSSFPPRAPVFGTSLSISLPNAYIKVLNYDEKVVRYRHGHVPIVVAKCGEFIKDDASPQQVEDFFEAYFHATAIGTVHSLSPMVDRLRRIFDSPDTYYGKNFEWTSGKYTVSDCLGLFLRYLVLLPEPIISFDCYEGFVRPFRRRAEGSILSSSSRGANVDHDTGTDKLGLVDKLEEQIRAFSAVGRWALFYILDIVGIFADMAIFERVIDLFQHFLLRHPVKRSNDEQRLCREVVAFLVRDQDLFVWAHPKLQSKHLAIVQTWNSEHFRKIDPRSSLRVAPAAAPKPASPDSKHRWLPRPLRRATWSIGPIVFGLPLTTSIQYAHVAVLNHNKQNGKYIYGYAPIVIVKCGNYLKRNANESIKDYISERYYAAAVSQTTETPRIRAIFDDPDANYGKDFDWTPYTVKDCVGVLLLYLSMLPSPIIPVSRYEDFVCPMRRLSITHIRSERFLYPTSTVRQPSPGDREHLLAHYKEEISKLPPACRGTLFYLLDVAAVLTCEISSQELAAWLQRPILRNYWSGEDAEAATDVVAFLIKEQDQFFYAHPKPQPENIAAMGPERLAASRGDLLRQLALI